MTDGEQLETLVKLHLLPCCAAQLLTSRRSELARGLGTPVLEGLAAFRALL